MNLNLKTFLASLVLLSVACQKEEITLETPKETVEQFQFNEPATGITHLLEIKGKEAELLVQSGECFRSTRDGDFINVELVIVDTVKEGVVMDVINDKNVTQIFVRIVEDIAEIPFGDVAIHAARVKRPWLIYKCN